MKDADADGLLLPKRPPEPPLFVVWQPDKATAAANEETIMPFERNIIQGNPTQLSNTLPQAHRAMSALRQSMLCKCLCLSGIKQFVTQHPL
jgi:hypothetical protein